MISGIINLKKEAGMTSHDAVFKLRKILHEKKIGHGGYSSKKRSNTNKSFSGSGKDKRRPFIKSKESRDSADRPRKPFAPGGKSPFKSKKAD